jgi:SAM-dependent methyltransferase
MINPSSPQPLRFHSAGDAAMIVLFSDPDPLDTYATHVSLWVESQRDCSLAVVDTALASLDRTTLASIIHKQAPPHRRLICTGFSAAGCEALNFAGLLNAEAALAVAPDWNRGATGADLSDDFNGSDARCHIILGQDGIHNSAPWREASLSRQHDLMSVALPVALQQSGLLAAALEALVEGKSPPHFDGMSDQWRQRLDYQLDIDLQDVYYDIRNALQLSGHIRNHGQNTLALEPADRILVGGKVLGPSPPRETRGALSKLKLGPGEITPFRLTFPNFSPEAGDMGLEIGLLCEGRFWFNWLGFPTLRLELGPQAAPPNPSIPAGSASAPELSEPPPPMQTPASSAADRPATPSDVASCYNIFLRRPPESDEVIGDHLKDNPQLWPLIQRFLSSPESLRQQEQSAAERISRHQDCRDVEVAIGTDEAAVLTQHIENIWSQYGRNEAYFSVLTNPQYLKSQITGEAIEDFYGTGRETVGHFHDVCERNLVTPPASSAVLELGCGVGRLGEAFRQAYATYVGVDISAGHLEIAKERFRHRSLSGVELRSLQNFLESKITFDIFYSIIVLQHNPPPMIYKLLDACLEKLAPGGYAYFQVPCFLYNYRFSVEDYIAGQGRKEEMEMHALPQHDVFSLLAKHNLVPIEVTPDPHIGAIGYSYTFFARKAAGPPNSDHAASQRARPSLERI